MLESNRQLVRRNINDVVGWKNAAGGMNNANPFNPAFLTPAAPGSRSAIAVRCGEETVGGMITFAGGVALYNKYHQVNTKINRE